MILSGAVRVVVQLATVVCNIGVRGMSPFNLRNRLLLYLSSRKLFLMPWM